MEHFVHFFVTEQAYFVTSVRYEAISVPVVTVWHNIKMQQCTALHFLLTGRDRGRVMLCIILAGRGFTRFENPWSMLNPLRL
jgi:hypothetical protein